VARILVVEDNAVLRGLILDVLEGSGMFKAEGAGTLADAEGRLDQGGACFDAILLDTGLPDGDGTALCLKLRASGFDRPIIFLSGESSDLDRQRSIDSGASEYLIKPVSMAFLVGRLLAFTTASLSPLHGLHALAAEATFKSTTFRRRTLKGQRLGT
jgi:DNA-binding response OmpR family regulator